MVLKEEEADGSFQIYGRLITSSQFSSASCSSNVQTVVCAVVSTARDFSPLIS